MEDLWSLYQKEKYGLKCLKYLDIGVMFYKMFNDGSCYVHTIFVRPEWRNKKIAQMLELLLIREESPNMIACDIDKLANGWEEVLDMFILHGWNINEETDARIVLCKIL